MISPSRTIIATALALGASGTQLSESEDLRHASNPESRILDMSVVFAAFCAFV